MTASAAGLSELDALRELPIGAVRRSWRKRFRTAPPAHRSKELLIRAYAFQLQVLAHGGLTRETKRRLEELALRFSENRAYAPAAARAPRTGSVYVRDWNERRYIVTKIEEGFLFDGQTYASLSAVAFAITGVKWSGPRFFRERPAHEARRP